jgi:hypothetical protein
MIRLGALSILFLLALSACEVKFNTGDGDAKNGFSYKNVDITHFGEFPVRNKEINHGETVDIKFSGIQGATQKDGYIHLGIRFEMKNEAGEIIEESEDVLSNIEQMDPKLNRVNVSFPVRDVQPGEKLFVTATLFDKYGTVEYPIEKEFLVVDENSPATKNVEIDHNFKFEPTVHCFQESQFYKRAPLQVEAGKQVNIKVSDFYEGALNGLFKCDYRILVTDLSKGQIIVDFKDQIAVSEEDLRSMPLSFSYTPSAPGKHLVEVFYENENEEKFHIQTHVNIK